MIIRNNCFETNSSSTHAFCIGQGKHIRTPFTLLNDFKSGRSNYENYEKTYFLNDEELFSIINKKEFDKYIDKALSDYENKDMYLILSRYKNIGRVYKEYKYFYEKLNFLWSNLIYYYKHKDSDWFKQDNYRCKVNLERSFEIFINNLTKVGFKLYCSDIEFVENFIKDKGYDKPVNLGLINNNIVYPSKWRNKYMKGLEAYGYYPIYEVCKIINDPILFWNCLLGDSIIYTGSDETGSFDNLDFSTYKFHLIGGSDWGSDLKVDEFKYTLPSLLGSYINGNYETKIYDDGTRTRELIPYNQYYYKNGLYKLDKFEVEEIDMMEPEFPESIDLKITNYCNNNCTFCYANSSNEGKHGKKIFIKNIISQMKPFTEIAIGGGNPLEHPDLLEILEYAKDRNVICNMTLKDIDAINNIDLINDLYQNGLIASFGISPTSIKTIKELKNSLDLRIDFILHLILGVHSLKFIQDIEKEYFDKILILGYKNIGKGDEYYKKYKTKIEKNIEEVGNYILNYNTKLKTNIISFDNLAIKQLNLEDYDNFNMYYQGEDGKFSFYIDAVEQTYSVSSLQEGNTFNYNNFSLLHCFKWLNIK